MLCVKNLLKVTAKNIGTSLKTRLIEMTTSPAVIGGAAAYAASRSIFKINVRENEVMIYDPLLKLVDEHTKMIVNRNYGVNRRPTEQSNVTVPSDATLFVMFPDNIPCFVKIKTYSIIHDRDENSYGQIIILTPSVYREKLLDMINNLIPSRFFLPTIQTMGRESMAIVEERYAIQRQFVEDHIYSLMDYRLDLMIDNPEYYTEAEIPHKETFFLYGPPGTGKSTLTRHFSAKKKVDIVCTDPKRAHSIRLPLTGKPVIILIEDIDSYEYLLKDEYRSEGVQADYSDFINFLDGVQPLANAIVIITSNHIEKLIPSIYRPGRVDHCLEVKGFDIERVLSYQDWSEDDHRTKFVKENHNQYVSVSTVKKLTLSKTLDDVETIYNSIYKPQ